MTPRIPGPRSRAFGQRLAAAESPNVTFLSEDFPVIWEQARGRTVRDVDGNEFIDTTAAFGVAALGHGHADVVAAIQEQARLLVHGMGDVYPSVPKVVLCEQLRDCAPFPDGRVILAGGGADAVEAALKTAALSTGRPGVIAFEGAYHGLTYGTLAISGREDFRLPWQSQLGRYSSLAPFPVTPEEIPAALHQLEQLLGEGTEAGPVGAVIVEPIQGRAGIRIPPEGFWPEVARLTRERGALLIADEIYTGLGRTGRCWALANDKVVPDLLVCGKALGGGMPIGACIGSPTAMAGWPRSDGEALHTSTFLGNPVVCAAACAALRVLCTPELRTAVHERGGQLIAGLRELAARHSWVADVRGRGLMIGVHVDTPARCSRIVREGLQHGLLLLGGGIAGDVLTFTPPLTITPAETAELLGRFADTLAICQR